MKTKTIILGLVIITLGVNLHFTLKANKLEETKTFLLNDLEALADDEFKTGPMFTNWKEYTTNCTYTRGVNGSITVGIPNVIGGTIGGSTSATWVEYNKSVCGQGAGTCLASAGC